MKVLIVYETLHGSSEKCAKMLRVMIRHETEVVRLKNNENISLKNYDVIVVGGSIHMGVIHTRVKKFIDNNHDTLIHKPHGLFLCCMEQGKNAGEQFEHAYPEELRTSAIASGLFGGEFYFKKMNLFERKFTRQVSKINSTISRIDQEEIRRFAEKINRLGFNIYTLIFP